MLGQRRRRWANIETALDECPAFARLSESPPARVATPEVLAVSRPAAGKMVFAEHGNCYYL